MKPDPTKFSAQTPCFLSVQSVLNHTVVTGGNMYGDGKHAKKKKNEWNPHPTAVAAVAVAVKRRATVRVRREGPKDALLQGV